MSLDSIEQWNESSEQIIQAYMEMIRGGIEPDLLKEVYTGVMKNLSPSPAHYEKMYSDIPLLVDIANERVQRERGLA